MVAMEVTSDGQRLPWLLWKSLQMVSVCHGCYGSHLLTSKRTLGPCDLKIIFGGDGNPSKTNAGSPPDGRKQSPALLRLQRLQIACN
jgi:hypothetical protein